MSFQPRYHYPALGFHTSYPTPYYPAHRYSPPGTFFLVTETVILAPVETIWIQPVSVLYPAPGAVRGSSHAEAYNHNGERFTRREPHEHLRSSSRYAEIPKQMNSRRKAPVYPEKGRRANREEKTYRYPDESMEVSDTDLEKPEETPGERSLDEESPEDETRFDEMPPGPDRIYTKDRPTDTDHFQHRQPLPDRLRKEKKTTRSSKPASTRRVNAMDHLRKAQPNSIYTNHPSSSAEATEQEISTKPNNSGRKCEKDGLRKPQPPEYRQDKPERAETERGYTRSTKQEHSERTRTEDSSNTRKHSLDNRDRQPNQPVKEATTKRSAKAASTDQTYKEAYAEESTQSQDQRHSREKHRPEKPSPKHPDVQYEYINNVHHFNIGGRSKSSRSNHPNEKNRGPPHIKERTSEPLRSHGERRQPPPSNGKTNEPPLNSSSEGPMKGKLPDYYAITGCSIDDNITAIKSKIRKKYLKVHPDKCQQQGTSDGEKAAMNARFIRVKVAAEVLENSHKKEAYDQRWRRHYG